MKRLGRCWSQISCFDNIYLAYRKAARGKRNKADVALFEYNLEQELHALQQALVGQYWQPGDYRYFTIYERKPRQIACAPFRDRVVHHALMNVLEPWLDQRMIQQSFACRKGKGVHLALNYYQAQASRFCYVLKLDIASYFPSIPHQGLKSCIRRYIKDRYALDTLDKIIDSAPMAIGLPIGNLTSQVLANLYLNQLDHRLQAKLGAYMRYVDDLMLFANQKSELWAARDYIAEELNKLGLQLHPRKQALYLTREKVDVLGYQLSPVKRWLRNDNGHRFARKLRAMQRAYALGKYRLEELRPSIQAWLGHAQHGETNQLRTRIMDKVVFNKG